MPGEAKYAQELANECVEVPDRYINKNASKEILNDSLPAVDLPVIDLSLLTSEEQLEKLRQAFSSWGCIQIINHGMETTMEELREATRQFFHLPMEEKQKYSNVGDGFEGYGTDKVILENQIPDWTDRLHLTITPEDAQKMQLWPENPQSFRKTLHEYTAGALRAIEILLQSAAKTLGLPENSILSSCGDKPISFCRLNYYPPCPRPELVFGLKPHTDGSLVTIVLPDKDVEGLHIQKDNQWYRVRTLAHALLFNAGDILEILSNGTFESPMHRAVTNPEKERITMAFFWMPEKGKEIGPMEGLIDENRPKLYKSVGDYVDITLKAYHNGVKPLDAMRI